MSDASYKQTAPVWRRPQSVPELTEQLISWVFLATFLLTGAVFLVFIDLLVWLLTQGL